MAHGQDNGLKNKAPQARFFVKRLHHSQKTYQRKCAAGKIFFD